MCFWDTQISSSLRWPTMMTVIFLLHLPVHSCSWDTKIWFLELISNFTHNLLICSRCILVTCLINLIPALEKERRSGCSIRFFMICFQFHSCPFKWIKAFVSSARTSSFIMSDYVCCFRVSSSPDSASESNRSGWGWGSSCSRIFSNEWGQ